MKTDLASSIGIAIVGVLIAYFVCNIFISSIEDYTFSVVTTGVSAEPSNPDPEIFNYEALNPTVEVYVGDSTDNDQENQ